MKCNKTTGKDGFTKELYNEFWSGFMKPFVRGIKYLSKQTVIKLILKEADTKF